jgi:hypothetical protein
MPSSRIIAKFVYLVSRDIIYHILILIGLNQRELSHLLNTERARRKAGFLK